jgi:phosphate starvation-inducible PhoH-like protein
MDIFHTHFGESHTENLIANGRIVAKPLAFMRGVTFEDSYILLSEAQNTTPEQMYLFLTRLGYGNKIVVEGDITQKDLKRTSGLFYAIDRLQDLDGIGTFNFQPEDCIRSPLVKQILANW